MEKLDILIDEATLQEKIEELAKKIMEDFQGRDLIFICILKGSTFFATDLARKVKSNVELEFIRVASYGEGTVSSGQVKMLLELKESIEGKDVIVIEDIIDTGRTLEYILDYLKAKNPRTLKLCALLDKIERRELSIPIDYVGFEIPNKFVIRIWTRL